MFHMESMFHDVVPDEVEESRRRAILKAHRAGPYTLSDVIAWGTDFTCRAVRLGVHSETGEAVAIKVLQQSELKGLPAGTVGRFKKDLLVLRDDIHDHPHIVNVHDSLASKKHVYITLDLCKGSLEDVVASEGALEIGFVRTTFAQMLEGVEAAHEAGLVHPHLTPDCVRFDAHSGVVRVSGFGLLALKQEAHRRNALAHRPPLHAFQCIAPEVIFDPRGGGYSTEADVWSLGVVLYTCLTGHMPFDEHPHADDRPAAGGAAAAGAGAEGNGIGDGRAREGGGDGDGLIPSLRKGSFHPLPPDTDAEAADLVSKMLVADPTARITVPEIKKHPFVVGATWMRRRDLVLLRRLLLKGRAILAPAAGMRAISRGSTRKRSLARHGASFRSVGKASAAGSASSVESAGEGEVVVDIKTPVGPILIRLTSTDKGGGPGSPDRRSSLSAAPASALNLSRQISTQSRRSSTAGGPRLARDVSEDGASVASGAHRSAVGRRRASSVWSALDSDLMATPGGPDGGEAFVAHVTDDEEEGEDRDRLDHSTGPRHPRLHSVGSSFGLGVGGAASGSGEVSSTTSTGSGSGGRSRSGSGGVAFSSPTKRRVPSFRGGVGGGGSTRPRMLLRHATASAMLPPPPPTPSGEAAGDLWGTQRLATMSIAEEGGSRAGSRATARDSEGKHGDGGGARDVVSASAIPRRGTVRRSRTMGQLGPGRNRRGSAEVGAAARATGDMTHTASGRRMPGDLRRQASGSFIGSPPTMSPDLSRNVSTESDTTTSSGLRRLSSSMSGLSYGGEHEYDAGSLGSFGSFGSPPRRGSAGGSKLSGRANVSVPSLHRAASAGSIWDDDDDDKPTAVDDDVAGADKGASASPGRSRSTLTGSSSSRSSGLRHGYTADNASSDSKHGDSSGEASRAAAERAAKLRDVGGPTYGRLILEAEALTDKSGAATASPGRANERRRSSLHGKGARRGSRRPRRGSASSADSDGSRKSGLSVTSDIWNDEGERPREPSGDGGDDELRGLMQRVMRLPPLLFSMVVKYL